MKAFVIGLALLALPATTPAWAASTDLPPELVTASATSFAEGSSSVICLLDPHAPHQVCLNFTVSERHGQETCSSGSVLCFLSNDRDQGCGRRLHEL